MKIGIYNHTYMFGSGIDGVLREVANRLSKKHQVEINTLFSNINEPNVKVLSDSKSKSVFNIYNLNTMIKVIKSVKQYDVVFTSIYPMNFFVSVGAHLYKKKHVSYFWGAPPAYLIEGILEKLYHAFLHFTECQVPKIVDTAIVPNKFIQRRNKIRKCKIIPMHGIDLKKFDIKNIKIQDIKKLKNTLKIPENATVIYMLGRVVPYKGIHLVMEALEKVGKEFPNLYFVIGGSLWNLKYVEKLKNLSRQRYDHRGIFAGMIEDKDMPLYYAMADIYVSASKWEGQLNVEAMAMKKPVIAFDTTSHRFAILNGFNGYLIPPFDIDEMAKKIAFLISNPDIAKTMGENGRVWVEINNDFDKITEKIEKELV